MIVVQNFGKLSSNLPGLSSSLYRTSYRSIQTHHQHLYSNSRFLNKTISSTLLPSKFSYCKCNNSLLDASNNFNLVSVRYTSFFNKVTAAQLWKGVTSVSNAGRKRGRGKGVGKKQAKDLNKGQVIGYGKVNMVWPGLNAPIIHGKELTTQKLLPPDTEREAKILKMRDSMGVFRPMRLSPLERGWSGTKMHGRSIGPPDPIGSDTFDDFDTKVLEMKTVTTMDGNIGRKKRFSVLAFTGNKKGLVGFAIGKNPDGRGALKRAKNKAGQKLLFIERYNDHTVLHDFHCAFGKTAIYVYKKHEGYGLVCHRAIRSMCELIGIKDLYAKVEGPTIVQNLVKAFILGLLRQKTYQNLANEKKLYLVEQREENGNLPIILAQPNEGPRKLSEISVTENLDFSAIGFDDRIAVRQKKYVPFYTRLPSWQNHLKKTDYRRNDDKVRLHLYSRYGGLKSHLTQIYPEADASYAMKLWKKQKSEAASSDS